MSRYANLIFRPVVYVFQNATPVVPHAPAPRLIVILVQQVTTHSLMILHIVYHLVLLYQSHRTILEVTLSAMVCHS